MRSTAFASVVCLLLCSLFGAACSDARNQEEKLKGYDLAKPEKFFMPESLLEISGIAFNKGSRDTVYAIQDEEGKLFKLPWKVKKQTHTKFGKRGDYEDLAILQNQAVILKSNGKIFSFPLTETASEETDSATEWKSLLPPGEYEGMFGDEQTGKLYVLCKHCSEDNETDRITGYIFQNGNPPVPQGGFSIDVRSIKSFIRSTQHGLRPSALAKNPVTGEWFILSSVNKVLVVTDAQWKIKQAVSLSPGEFNQPEGIAFDSRGNLYISNEGGDLSEGNVLLFNRLSK